MMNAYDEALYKVLDQMLAAKGCELENSMLRHSLADKFRNKIREIGTRTSRAANHAGRATPTYWDVEFTFGQMGIDVADLKTMVCTQPIPEDRVVCPKPKTRDEDFHKGPEPDLSETSGREAGGFSHIPDHLPPFPGAHTYKETPIKKSIDKDYEKARKIHAENQLSVQRALNKFYLGSEPNISLTGVETKEDSFKVLTQNPRKQLACMSALMPKSEVFEKDIYEDKEEITHAALNNPFLVEPKLKSSRQTNDDEVVEIQELRKDVELVELDSESD